MWQTLPTFNFLASKFKKSCCTIRRLWCFFLCQGSGKNNSSQEKGLTELWDDYAIEAQGVLDFTKIFGNNNDVVLEIGKSSQRIVSNIST
jgi:hypothetical protein